MLQLINVGHKTFKNSGIQDEAIKILILKFLNMPRILIEKFVYFAYM